MLSFFFSFYLRIFDHNCDWTLPTTDPPPNGPGCSGDEPVENGGMGDESAEDSDSVTELPAITKPTRRTSRHKPPPAPSSQSRLSLSVMEGTVPRRRRRTGRAQCRIHVSNKQQSQLGVSLSGGLEVPARNTLLSSKVEVQVKSACRRWLCGSHKHRSVRSTLTHQEAFRCGVTVWIHNTSRYNYSYYYHRTTTKIYHSWFQNIFLTFTLV